MPTNRQLQTGDAIIIRRLRGIPKQKQAMARAIELGYGLLKRKSAGKTFAEEWVEHKREERDIDDAKERRNACS